MKIEQEFTLGRPRAEIWAFFHGIPQVAACLPGAEYLGEKEPGSHAGRVSMKVGPFQAAFEGAADVAYDETAYTVSMSGKGVDKRGASRGRMTMVCALHDVADGTRVTIDADVQLSGSIAQFGRTGIIQEITATLISDFVTNVEQALPPREALSVGAEGEESDTVAPSTRPGPARRELSGTRILWLSLRNWVRSLFSGR